MLNIIENPRNHSGNGFGGNGHAEFGKTTKPAKKTRRVKPHLKNGHNQAACRAYGAALLILKCNFTIDQAIACTGSHTNYIVAMKWIMANGDWGVLDRVLRGRLDLFSMAAQVRPMVEIKAAYRKLAPKQRIAWAAEEGAEKLFDEVIGPATVSGFAGEVTNATA
jgi:hypothetical protein